MGLRTSDESNGRIKLRTSRRMIGLCEPLGDRIGAILLGGRKQRAKSLKPVQEKEIYSVLQ